MHTCLSVGTGHANHTHMCARPEIVWAARRQFAFEIAKPPCPGGRPLSPSQSQTMSPLSVWVRVWRFCLARAFYWLQIHQVLVTCCAPLPCRCPSPPPVDKHQPFMDAKPASAWQWVAESLASVMRTPDGRLPSVDDCCLRWQVVRHFVARKMRLHEDAPDEEWALLAGITADIIDLEAQAAAGEWGPETAPRRIQDAPQVRLVLRLCGCVCVCESLKVS